MISLYDLLRLKYPDNTIGFPNGQIQLADYGDGKGPVISVWEVEGITQPTTKQLKDLEKDTTLQAKYQVELNIQANKPIYDKLEEIDLKSIRALRVKDEAKLIALEIEAVGLREQLLPVTIDQLT